MNTGIDKQEMATPQYISSNQGNLPHDSRKKRLDLPPTQQLEFLINIPVKRLREDDSTSGSLRRRLSTDGKSSEHMNADPKPSIRLKLLCLPMGGTSKPKTRSTASGANHRDYKQDSRLVGAQDTDDVVPVNPTMTESVTINRELAGSEPGVCLDASLVEFGLRVQLQDSALVDQIHMFSASFFKRMDAGKKACDYRRVKKWSWKSDIFSKKFIIVPVNDEICWHLAIICFPGHMLKDTYPQPPAQLASCSSNVAEEKTWVVILDPCEREHRRTFRLLREYLQAEARERHGKVVDITDTELIDVQHLLVPLEPNQDDCGIYFLHYVKTFFANPLEIMALGPDARDKRKEEGNRYDELWKTDQVKDRRTDLRKKLHDLSAEWLAFNSSYSKNVTPTMWALDQDLQGSGALASGI